MTANKKPIYFAPLQGYTDAAYRTAQARIFGGVERYYTPFIRIDRGEVRSRDIRDILPENNQGITLIPQLMAGDADELETLIAVVADNGYTEMDINLGCPFPLLVRRHKGCGMLPYPDEVKAILESMGRHPEIKFSVKMRPGMENLNEGLALLPMLNDAKLEHITLHPRLGRQQYKGDADMDLFQAFYESCKHPLIYNGDVLTTTDIERVIARFPDIKAIMIGRGLLMNPALAKEYSEDKMLTPDERVSGIRKIHEIVYRHYAETLNGGDSQLLSKIQPFWEYPGPSIEKKVLKKLLKSTKLDNYLAAVSMVTPRKETTRVMFIDDTDSISTSEDN